jgi:glycosyltransferase involved in cell wall biosynthesis
MTRTEADTRSRRVARFGVVTPTLNAERYLEQTLESIWSQTGDGVEVDHIVVDGGSADATLEIASRYPSRRIVATDDQGMYDAINRGMRMVRGDIVGYLNADDELAPGAFAAVFDSLDAHPETQWVCGRLEYIDGQGQILGAMTPVHLDLPSFVGLGWNCISQPTVWIRRSFYDRVGPFDISLRNCGDYDWLARALRLAQPMILNSTVARFRLHGDQLSFDPEAMERESSIIRDRYGGRGAGANLRGLLLSLRLNLRNPRWLVAKRTGRIRFTG